jgi:HPt (histidine-containing phosphotransfer) domain-containing protein
MNEHVGKPFNIDHLVQTLLRLTRYVVPIDSPSRKPANDVPLAPANGLSIQPHAELEVQEALNRLGGDLVLYKKVLQSFTKDMVWVPAQLSSYLKSGNSQEAGRALHTLKGLAATVGAMHLSRCAAQGEARLKNGITISENDGFVDELQAHIHTSMKAIQRVQLELKSSHAPESPQDSTPVQPVDRKKLAADLMALAGLLAQSDMGALDVHASIQQRYAAALGTEIELLDEAMAGLDFSNASEACDSLIRNYSK